MTPYLSRLSSGPELRNKIFRTVVTIYANTNTEKVLLLSYSIVKVLLSSSGFLKTLPALERRVLWCPPKNGTPIRVNYTA
ncbi:MAG: hypothetical protein UY03_C0020G0011 [Parcubacteria group bacterium GW2011_GWA2_47_64]|nr:MAG: hypothetical protein UY03_C0020G0011 [Parcubacteria group bacterium GW2011_GWA2_47_64]KKU95787.1 MAG: hypothetical protein UY29_C0019G0007 [Parcubacteria group bacterium GW2011_GWC2_48_17]